MPYAALSKDRVGAPSRDRTCSLQLRRLTLYPIELWARLAVVGFKVFHKGDKRVNTFGREGVVDAGADAADRAMSLESLEALRTPLPVPHSGAAT